MEGLIIFAFSLIPRYYMFVITETLNVLHNFLCQGLPGEPGPQGPKGTMGNKGEQVGVIAIVFIAILIIVVAVSASLLPSFVIIIRIALLAVTTTHVCVSIHLPPPRPFPCPLGFRLCVYSQASTSPFPLPCRVPPVQQGVAVPAAFAAPR